jgi:rhamnogalacturonyl hydrolase YesR
VELLYYRDGTYVYPSHKTLSGEKDFWARGDGWVFAALAKVLKDLPLTDNNRPFYETRFRNMAAALIKIQQPEGYWTRSLLDPAQAEGRETSGTAFFTYGLLWGGLTTDILIKQLTYQLQHLDGAIFQQLPFSRTEVSDMYSQ